MNRVFVVSDSTGQTAERVLRAALAQFEGADVRIERRSDIRSEAQVHQVVEEAAQSPTTPPATVRPSTWHSDDHASSHVSELCIPMGFGQLAQRIGPIDHGPDVPSLNQFVDDA